MLLTKEKKHTFYKAKLFLTKLLNVFQVNKYIDGAGVSDMIYQGFLNSL